MKKLLYFTKTNRFIVDFTSFFFPNNILFLFQDPIHEPTLHLGISDVYVYAVINIIHVVFH